MKLLLIFVTGVLLTSCGSKKSGNSNGGSNGGSSPTVPLPTVSIATDLANITAANAANFMLSGTCSEEGESITVVVGEGEEDSNPETAPTCTDGAWTTEVDVTGLNKMEEVSVTAIHTSSDGATSSEATRTVTNEFICPTNYVGAPALSGYTTNSFCVMKYEAKNDGSASNNAVSTASGLPYVNISRADSIDKCTGLNSAGEDKHDLITNDEWQSIARIPTALRAAASAWK